MADALHPRSDELSGRLVAGRYRLERLIATGGMAQVWEGSDEVLARPVAVKVLHPHLAADESFVERFRGEAVAAARLAHPAIVSIFDTCSDDGLEAIVMELVRGSTLRRHLDEHGALESADAVAVVGQVADALQVAHRAGLVHRDVKPANILLCDDGRVMVADFGIAKAAEAVTDLTQEGTLLGTAKYLAPEQVEGGPVDPRTDVYALGVVLYEALCGRPPFVADTDAATALARLHGEPLRPRQLRAGIPRRLEEVVLRAMARQPDDRYPTAADLRTALLAAEGADHTGSQPAVLGRPRPEPATPLSGAPSFAQSERGWLVPALLVTLVAVALGVAGVLIGRTSTGQDLIDRVGEAVGGSEDGGAGGEARLALAGVRTFDPQGRGTPGENDREAPLAVDGDPGTLWETEGYERRDFGIKDGVGLILDLEGAADLGQLHVSSPTRDWAAAVYVSEQPGDSLASWGEPVDEQSGIDGDHAFELGGRRGTAVLLWITDLGDEPPRVRARIAELVVER